MLHLANTTQRNQENLHEEALIDMKAKLHYWGKKFLKGFLGRLIFIAFYMKVLHEPSPERQSHVIWFYIILGW